MFRRPSLLPILAAMSVVVVRPVNSTSPTTTLVSVNQAGKQAGLSFAVAITPNGRFVLFESDASDLVVTPDTNGASDVFVRDLKTRTTTLVSINSSGTASGNNFSHPKAISANGRFVAFESAASDLVATPTNLRNAYVRDLKTRTTTLVSVNSSGTASGNSDSSPVAISPNGRFVLFQSQATDLVGTADSSPPSSGNVFVRDLGAVTRRALVPFYGHGRP